MNQENKKKDYIKPEMEVMAFSHQTNLLDCSKENEEYCGETD